jgi:hypothetical protein
MKLTIVVCSFIAVASHFVLSQTSNRPAEIQDRAALIKLTDEITKAKTRRDITGLDRLLGDDYILTNPAGLVANKSEYLDGAGADTATYESVVNYDQAVKIYGNAAVVTGTTSVKGAYDGHDIGGLFRFTHVFVKRQDRWQAVATQLTRIIQ